MSTLFLIVARAGSKGVPGKNLRKIGGLSLIGWKAAAARHVMQHYSKDAALIISTDCPAMQAEAAKHGVSVPFTRPAELATDTASSASVIRHAIEWIETNWRRTFTDIMLLEPSAPFATGDHLHQALLEMAMKDPDLVCGMKHVPTSTAFIGRQKDDGDITPIIVNMERHGLNLRRQDLRPEWTMNGALYLFAWEMFKRTGSIYGGARNIGLLMDPWHSIEIDSHFDLELAHYAYERGHVHDPRLSIIEKIRQWIQPPQLERPAPVRLVDVK